MNQKDFEKWMRDKAHHFDVTVPKPGIYRYYIAIDFEAGGNAVDPD